jgi:nitroimidazol reductase NimA-like FMN-containing flavoprotein (pyridoxamine 5'-phosphate oxidase superfamily)
VSSYGLEVLDRDECLALLRSRSIGRVGFTLGENPLILPVNYSLLGDDVVFRTDPGAKLTAAVLRAKVAFEVDQAAPFSHEGWSVLVVGYAEEVTERAVRAEVDKLPLRPWAEGARDSIVRIRTEHVTGRRIRHRG